MSKDMNKSWADVTLSQIQEIESLPKFDNQIDTMVETLAILLDMDPSDVEDMNVNDIMSEYKKWEFLGQTPEPKQTPLIKIGGKRFGCVDFKEMTLAQMTDIEEYVSDGLMKNLHKIMAVIYLPVRKYNPITKKFKVGKYEGTDDRAELFQEITMDVFYPLALFFYHIVKSYLDDFQSSLVQTKMKEMMKEIQMDQKLSEVQKVRLLNELKESGIGLE